MLDGPVYFPKLYNGRNRTFFLFNWEAYRQVNGASNIATVPTLAQRAGNFTQSVDVNNKRANVADPFSGGAPAPALPGKIGNCFPGNIIPASRMDPIATKVMAYYPLPTGPGNANNFYTVTSDPDYWDSFVGKIDQRIFSSDNLSVRFLKRFNRNSNPYNGSAGRRIRESCQAEPIPGRHQLHASLQRLPHQRDPHRGEPNRRRGVSATGRTRTTPRNGDCKDPPVHLR